MIPAAFAVFVGDPGNVGRQVGLFCQRACTRRPETDLVRTDPVRLHGRVGRPGGTRFSRGDDRVNGREPFGVRLRARCDDAHEEFVACKILGFDVDAEYLAAVERQSGALAKCRRDSVRSATARNQDRQAISICRVEEERTQRRIAEPSAGRDGERQPATVEEQAEVGELTSCVARCVTDAVGVREPAVQRPAPQHRGRILLRHRDASVEAQSLLDRWIIEGDQPERPVCDERAEPAVRFPFADQPRVAVDLRERPVIDEVGVRDRIFSAVARSIEAVPPVRVALRPQRVRVPMQTEDDEVLDDVKREPRRGKIAGRSRKAIEVGRIDRQDPCAFEAATS